MHKYRTLFKRPMDKESKIIHEFDADNFNSAYIITKNSILQEMREEHKQPTLEIVMLAQLPKGS